MQISLIWLFSFFCLLVVIQHLVFPILIKKNVLKRKGVNAVVKMQIVVTVYCVWISASTDKETFQLGTGLLITSFLLFMWTQYKLK
jgi:hypothetical protein